MSSALRDSVLLVCGVLLGIVAGAALILFLHFQPDAEQASATTPEPEVPQTARMGAAAAPTGESAPQPQQVAATHVACPLRPLLAAVDNRDGQLLPPADVSRLGMDEAERLLVAGKEAAASGRTRDAEVALLTSCRIADARKGAGSVEAASARYQLGRHYAELAAAQGNAPAGEREELRRRAQAFYNDSLQSFRSTLGPSHEKTRFAAEALAALQPAVSTPAPAVQAGANTSPAPVQPSQAAVPDKAAPAVAVTKPVPPAKPLETASTGAPPKTESAATSRPATAKAAAPREGVARNNTSPPAARAQAAPAQPAEPRVRQATGDPGVPLPVRPNESAADAPASLSLRPSFDCAKARSVPEKIICGDPRLAQLDRELGRLHARAKNAAPDPAAFKRQNDREWRQREATCRDRACLLDWYAQRRRQLEDALSEVHAQGQESATMR